MYEQACRASRLPPEPAQQCLILSTPSCLLEPLFYMLCALQEHPGPPQHSHFLGYVRKPPHTSVWKLILWFPLLFLEPRCPPPHLLPLHVIPNPVLPPYHFWLRTTTLRGCSIPHSRTCGFSGSPFMLTELGDSLFGLFCA